MSETGARVLIVDDERPIRRFLRASLVAHGFEVNEAVDGQEALDATVIQRPDIVILDLNLPDIDGIEVTRRLREWCQVPIIILSVREQEQDKIRALDAGADDYLTKPFSTGELLARMRVALRHSQKTDSTPIFRVGALEIDREHRQVSIAGREVALTPTEYEILRLLVQYAGKVITHRQMLQKVWGDEYAEESHLLRVNVSNLRHKIEPNPAQPYYILTESGVGYRLRDSD